MSNINGPLYQVGGIKGRKEVSGRTFYKIHWAGYSNDQDSWEPESNLSNCKDLLDMFNAEQERKEQRRVTRSSSKAREIAGLSSDDEIDSSVAINKTPRSTKRYTRQSYVEQTTLSATKILSTPTTTRPVTQIKKAATSPRRPRKVTTDDLTPSRYYLRFSTIKQRPPLHSSDDINKERASPKRQVSSSTEQVNVVRQTETRDDNKFVSHQQLLLPSKSSHPTWMNLGMAEMLLCLVILALVIASLGYLQYNLKTTTFSNP